MTPAIEAARDAGLDFTIHEYESATRRGYGAEAATSLGVPAEQVFKTLVARLDSGSLVVAVVPVAGELDLKRLAQVAGAKRASMAPPRDAERATGYVLGGISPLGQKQRLATYIDTSAFGFDRIYVSAGRRGLEIGLAPESLQSVCGASPGPIARPVP